MIPLCQALTHFNSFDPNPLGEILGLDPFIDVETEALRHEKFTQSTVRKWCSQHEKPSIGKRLGAFMTRDNISPNTALFRLSIQDTDARRARVPSRPGLLARCLLPSDALEKMKRTAPACPSVCLSSQQWRWRCEQLSNQEVTPEKARALCPLPLLLAWLWLPADSGPVSPPCAQLSLSLWKNKEGIRILPLYYFRFRSCWPVRDSWSHEFSKWVELDPPLFLHT